MTNLEILALLHKKIDNLIDVYRDRKFASPHSVNIAWQCLGSYQHIKQSQRNYIIFDIDNINVEKVKLFLEARSYNILSKTVNETKIQLFVQTNAGLEELIIDEELFASPYFSESTFIFTKLKERDLTLFEGRDLIELLEEIESLAKKGAYIQRYKGLGEMNPEQLWETTMTPENRRLLRVKIEDAEIASDTFTLFMGDEVEPRRNYIESHAKDVEHLDV